MLATWPGVECRRLATRHSGRGIRGVRKFATLSPNWLLITKASAGFPMISRQFGAKRKLFLLNFDDEREKGLAGLDQCLMRHSRRHYQDITGSHFLGFSTHDFGPADLTISGVT